MKKLITIMALFLTTGSVFAQKKTTAAATVIFDATTPKDNLPKAENKTVIGSIDTKTGEVAFEAPVKNFSFSNPKIQEHFNGANWMNSDTYPVFTFTGKIENHGKVKYNKDGVYKVNVHGDMKIKDISKKIKIPGTITVNGDKISIASSFKINLEHFNISGPPIESGKVSKEPNVTVAAEF